MESEKIIAVLRDRAREAESKAMDAQISATASKWISAVIAGGAVGVIEAAKKYFGN